MAKANPNRKVNHKGDEHIKQIVSESDSMYKHIDHYLKFCILRSIVLIIQRAPRGRCGKNAITSSKRFLCFQNEHSFVLYDQQ